MADTTPRRLLRADQVAERLGLSPQTLAARRCRGDGPRYVKIGSAVRYDLGDVELWVDSHRRTSTSDDGTGPARAA